MRHRRSGRKLGRDASHRKALYANLASALIEHGRIKTTAAKAKEVKPIAEQMITLGRRGGVHARRQALAYLRSQDVVYKLFSDVGPRFVDRNGGYCGSSASGPGRATPPRWSTSSSSTTCRRRRSSLASAPAARKSPKPPQPLTPRPALTPAITSPASVT
jgi:large subunit ribosomal protein L17